MSKPSTTKFAVFYFYSVALYSLASFVVGVFWHREAIYAVAWLTVKLGF